MIIFLKYQSTKYDAQFRILGGTKIQGAANIFELSFICHPRQLSIT